MHTRPMAEHEGDFSAEQRSDRPCPKCKATEVNVLVWESKCGGYEDYKYTCAACGHSWWVDGIDS